MAALVLAVAAPLPGCKKHSGENFGLLETAPTVTATPSGAELTRADLLLQLLSLSHAEVTARLGAHRIESQTQWSITPVVAAGAAAGPSPVKPGFKADSPAQPYDGGAAWESTAVTLDETRSIAVDAAGRLQLVSQNDHGTGVEAVLDQNFLYLRMRYAPYIRYKAEGDQVTRLRAMAYESGASLLEAVAPYVRLSAPVEAMAAGLPVVATAVGDVPGIVAEDNKPLIVEADDEADDGQHEEDEEQHLCNAGGTGGDAPEAEQRSHQGDDEEDDSVVQHELLLWIASPHVGAATGVSLLPQPARRRRHVPDRAVGRRPQRRRGGAARCRPYWISPFFSA